MVSSLAFFSKPWERLLYVARRVALLEIHWRFTFLRATSLYNYIGLCFFKWPKALIRRSRRRFGIRRSSPAEEESISYCTPPPPPAQSCFTLPLGDLVRSRLRDRKQPPPPPPGPFSETSRGGTSGRLDWTTGVRLRVTMARQDLAAN